MLEGWDVRTEDAGERGQGGGVDRGVSGEEDREGAGGGIGTLETVGNGDGGLEVDAKRAGEGEELARAPEVGEGPRG